MRRRLVDELAATDVRHYRNPVQAGLRLLAHPSWPVQLSTTGAQSELDSDGGGFIDRAGVDAYLASLRARSAHDADLLLDAAENSMRSFRLLDPSDNSAAIGMDANAPHELHAADRTRAAFNEIADVLGVPRKSLRLNGQPFSGPSWGMGLETVYDNRVELDAVFDFDTFEVATGRLQPRPWFDGDEDRLDRLSVGDIDIKFGGPYWRTRRVTDTWRRLVPTLAAICRRHELPAIVTAIDPPDARGHSVPTLAIYATGPQNEDELRRRELGLSDSWDDWTVPAVVQLAQAMNLLPCRLPSEWAQWKAWELTAEEFAAWRVDAVGAADWWPAMSLLPTPLLALGAARRFGRCRTETTDGHELTFTDRHGQAWEVSAIGLSLRRAGQSVLEGETLNPEDGHALAALLLATGQRLSARPWLQAQLDAPSPFSALPAEAFREALALLDAPRR